MHPGIRKILNQLEQWKKALMGPLVTICLLFYQQATGKSPTWGWFVALIAGGLAWQFYSEHREVSKRFENRAPKLFLRHVEPRHDRFKDLKEMSGFFVQVEGANKAFNVRIVSPDAVGREHTRLEMLWGRISTPVGNEPVPVPALCSSRKGNSGSSIIGSQIDAYMKMKAAEPKELVAIVAYRDVDGNECPIRKFRIHRERDITGELVTHCDLTDC